MGRLVLSPRARHEIDQKYWKILGNGDLGGKAEELRKCTAEALAAGFYMHPRIVATMGTFRSVERWEYAKDLILNGRASSSGIANALWYGRGTHELDVERLANETTFSPNDIADMMNILRYLPKGVPLAVRSSAYGDACGNGNYSSKLVYGASEAEQWERLRLAVIRVLLSQFDKKAIAYRTDLGLPEGIAVMFEPVLGVRWGDNQGHFGPCLGGYAVSRMGSIEGMTIVWDGLPSMAVRVIGSHLTEGMESATDELTIGEAISDGRYSTPEMKRMYARDSGKIELISFTDGEKQTCLRGLVTPEIGVSTEITVNGFFSLLNRLAGYIGKRIYIEYGVVGSQGKPEVGLLQLAEYKQELGGSVELNGTEITVGRRVENGGEKTCDGIFVLDNCMGFSRLQEYNKTHRNYLLVIDASTVSGLRDIISYDSINNASAIIEDGGDAHGAGDLNGHLGGGPKQKGVILAYAPSAGRDIEKAAGGERGIAHLETEEREGITRYRIYAGKVRVCANVLEQRVAVYGG